MCKRESKQVRASRLTLNQLPLLSDFSWLPLHLPCCTCRVYFHKTTDSETDYLVDHSIIMYLIDPAGEFVTFYGKNFTAQQLADSIMQHIRKW